MRSTCSTLFFFREKFVVKRPVHHDALQPLFRPVLSAAAAPRPAGGLMQLRATAVGGEGTAASAPPSRLSQFSLSGPGRPCWRPQTSL